MNTLEHEFLSSGDDSMLLLLRLAQFVACGLILATNVPMIVFIMKQGSKTFLDWMIVFDCFLCLSNLYPVTKFGLNYERNGETIHYYYDNHGFCFWVFFIFFCNLCNRLLTLGIVIYRFALVLGSSFWFPSHRKKVLEKIIIFTIFFIPLTLTGWNVYYREHYKHFLVCSGRSHEFYYSITEFYQNKKGWTPPSNPQWSLPETNPFYICSMISLLSSMVVTPVGYTVIYWYNSSKRKQ